MTAIRTLLALLVLTISASTLASQTAEAEIEYLLHYVEESGCLFIRNGDEHASPSAASHLRLKYSRGKRYAGTAEQFIDRLASESSWTGETYQVSCEGEIEPAGDWLHRALAEHREPAL